LLTFLRRFCRFIDSIQAIVVGQRCMALILRRRIFHGIFVATCIILFCNVLGVCLKLYSNKN
jgi:hypothetical protein